ncbi:F-box/LRR-repeat protein At3g48880-like [Rosa rugosa]|uniref:F-box/LRR-repeat protein At3g48880-like n=1 Tax=Rosa rugosa TaxID=74645 RepID=UPI002B40B960|nr:F-box/LRR-repeat protein At3g48880-like [Rosa rugosa]
MVTGKNLFVMKMNNKYNFRNQGEMGNDLISRIFMSLSVMDVIHCGSVCCSWREVSSNTRLWKTIDLTKVDSEIFLQSRSGHIAMGILNAVFSRGKDVTCLVFNYYFYMRNSYLIHVSQRILNLKRLVLPVIGKHCNKFAEMKLMCDFYEEYAEAVAAYIPNLKVLSLRCAEVSRGAVLHILNEMNHLQVLNLSHSYIVDHAPTPNRCIVVLRELDQMVIEAASWLKKFLFSRSRLYCNICRLQLSMNGVLMRCRYEERVWRMDEVSSLAH